MSSFWELISLSTPRSRLMVFGSGILVLAILPTSQLNWLPIRSVWETLLGVKPYSSGITRSVSMILHGNWSQAWLMNPLGFAVIGVISGLIVIDVVKIVRRT